MNENELKQTYIFKSSSILIPKLLSLLFKANLNKNQVGHITTKIKRCCFKLRKSNTFG